MQLAEPCRGSFQPDTPSESQPTKPVQPREAALHTPRSFDRKLLRRVGFRGATHFGYRRREEAVIGADGEDLRSSAALGGTYREPLFLLP